MNRSGEFAEFESCITRRCPVMRNVMRLLRHGLNLQISRAEIKLGHCN
jgi:hypothetical protein